MCPGVKHLIRFNNKLRSSSLCLCRVCAKIISAGISWKEGRKEGKKGGRGKEVIITLFYGRGRFQFKHLHGQQLNIHCKVIN